ncbi:hypothetical protein N0V88_001362 [Collariella sp. IMI 366227]|nr:hypothetical protein N0V88_001362 [Collariella sp. IMI 366227]
MTIYIFRGLPDVWNKRHVLLYFTSPDLSNFFETVHAQYKVDDDDPNKGEWMVDQVHKRVQWDESRTYLTHVNAGALVVSPGQEMMPVDIIAATPIKNRPGDWNCQSFLYEGMQELVAQGYHGTEWYDWVEGEVMDRLLDTNVG